MELHKGDFIQIIKLADKSTWLNRKEEIEGKIAKVGTVHGMVGDNYHLYLEVLNSKWTQHGAYIKELKKISEEEILAYLI